MCACPLLSLSGLLCLSYFFITDGCLQIAICGVRGQWETYVVVAVVVGSGVGGGRGKKV